MPSHDLTHNPTESWALFGHFAAGHSLAALLLSMAVTEGSFTFHLGNALVLVGAPYVLFFAIAAWKLYTTRRPPAYHWYVTTALVVLWMNLFWLFHFGQHYDWGVNTSRAVTVATLAFWIYHGARDRNQKKH